MGAAERGILSLSLYKLTPVLRITDTESSTYGDAVTAPTLQAYLYPRPVYVFGDIGDQIIVPAYTAATTATSQSNVGDYPISGVQFTTSNRGIAYRVVYTGTYTITPRPITVTADAKSMVYGDSVPNLTYGITGGNLVNGDTLAGRLATAATAASDVGGYAITQGTFGNGNYAITYVPGALTITPATLTVTAGTTSTVYGDRLPSLGYGVSGWKNGQTDGLLSGVTVATFATSTANVGTYATRATGGTLSGAAAGNYTLAYVDGSISVTPRPITVTADPKSMVYGNAVPALTFAIGGAGLVNGDTLSGTLATAATSASNVGSYAIDQGSLAASSNYALTYGRATLEVTPAMLTVTAGDGTMVYGDPVPAVGWRALGWKNGQTDALLSGVIVSSGASSTSNVGTYATIASAGTLSGPALGNYALTYVGGLFAVTPATLTVTADSASALRGSAVPRLGFSATGWKNGQTGALLDGVTVTTEATSTATPGRYAVHASGGRLVGAAAGNYTIVSVDGVLTVVQAIASGPLAGLLAGQGAPLDGMRPQSVTDGGSGSASGANDGFILRVENRTSPAAACPLGSGFAPVCATP